MISSRPLRSAPSTLLALVVCAVVAQPGDTAAARDVDDRSLTAFLAGRQIDRAQRQVLEEAGGWSDGKQDMLIRVLARLAAPAALEAGWAADAVAFAPDDPSGADRLVRIRGQAVFVAPLVLSAEQATLADRPTFDLVRLRIPVAGSAEGIPITVVSPAAPRAWKTWQPIDEPAEVLALPLAVGAAGVPAAGAPPAGGTPFPEAPPALLAAASGIAWQPDTPLGTLGMNYALFDTVVDGGKLQPGDTEAFYGMLAAAGRATPAQIEAAAFPGGGGPTDIVPLINPAEKWFARHRGDPVTIAGVARKATRIAIDEPFRRQQVGADHYWEVFVFVETPPLVVDGREQDSYPVVCCVRSLPPGMPTGDRIAEQVRIPGFALKRYGYPLADVTIISSQGDEVDRDRRMETPLVIGPAVVWEPAPAVARGTGPLVWTVAARAAALLAALLVRNLAFNRQARRDAAAARAALPEKFQLPPEDMSR
jgi:hypothetical protein